jgi:hypothetical protein
VLEDGSQVRALVAAREGRDVLPDAAEHATREDSPGARAIAEETIDRFARGQACIPGAQRGERCAVG